MVEGTFGLAIFAIALLADLPLAFRVQREHEKRRLVSHFGPGEIVKCGTVSMKVLERKGGGAQGSVWSAALPLPLEETQPTDALKVLTPGKQMSTFESVNKECNALLAYANAGARVPRCHAACELQQENGPRTFALVMDFVQAEGLDKVWDRVKTGEGWAQGVGEGLVKDIFNNMLAAFRAGWLDMDKKPDNIMVDLSAQTTTFIDMGLAANFASNNNEITCKDVKDMFPFVFASFDPFLNDFPDLIRSLFQDAIDEKVFDIVVAGEPGEPCTVLASL
jgi:hypothetical protein